LVRRLNEINEQEILRIAMVLLRARNGTTKEKHQRIINLVRPFLLIFHCMYLKVYIPVIPSIT